jgi:hypothetical protein
MAMLVLMVGTAVSPRDHAGRLVELILLTLTLGIAIVELRTPGQRR